MKPKFTRLDTLDPVNLPIPPLRRVLSIGEDNELHSHFVKLEEADDDLAVQVDAIRGKHPQPTRSVEDVVSENLEFNHKFVEGAGDAVNLPAHYARFKIEPALFVEENNLGFLRGNAIKYMCRWDAKDGLQDLDKAIRCLEMYREKCRGNPDWWKRRTAA